jgi:hypothetical protein
MTVPANLTYSAVETRVMNSLRLATTNTTEQAKVQNLINEVYRDIAAKADWWWLLKRAVINTVAKITAGTVDVTKGSTSITFSIATGTDVSGYVFIISGSTDDSDAVYRIATNPAGGTAATLDAAYTGATNTAASYSLYKDAYSLPTDTGKVINVKRYGYLLPLQRVGIEDLSVLKLTDQSENKPQLYSVFDTATTGDPTTARLLQVHPYPDKAYRLEVFYKQNLNTELTGTARPLIPDDYSQILVYGSLARGYAIFLADTDRSQFFQGLFNDVMALMVAQQKEYAHDNAGVAPRDGYRRATSRRRSGNVTLGSLFDRWPGGG